MIRYFNSKALKEANLTPRECKIQDIIGALARLSHKNRPIFIEYSLKGSDKVIDIMTSNGHTYLETTHHSYYMGGKERPHVLISFNTDKVIEYSLDDKTLIKYVMGLMKPNVVFDPFSGIGFTGKQVNSCGIEYIGYEFNPERHKKMLKVVK